ncbi:phosphatidylinositol N-acetylglucosaminyltransferase subunit P [Bemisia tabaci]|uniref:phosphatidylinositol N-acetylglucosaminyltransferase subunit P n=1 Tax=Bemisia tabaci TaxID=7038 RepID=UPI0008F99B05|nr:PREDICTED: phosphatidylinositol N-acetylglucosaminyltransferase subunit P isoform X1 [Bemisia tabaci]
MPESTPTPTPSRANYGFALYLASYSAFGIFLVWAIVPDSYLHALGLTYLPQKYWALALPIHLCNTLALFAFVFYPALNLMLVPDPNDMRVITDSYALKPRGAPKQGGIPSVSDIPISEVCKQLYSGDGEPERINVRRPKKRQGVL